MDTLKHVVVVVRDHQQGAGTQCVQDHMMQMETLRIQKKKANKILQCRVGTSVR